MRKIQTLTLAALLILGLSGCEKWLEATSSSQISGEQLFSERAGFHEALSGVYMLMGSGSCYGRNYTWFVNELTAAPLVSQNGDLFSDLQNGRYTSVKAYPYFDGMWLDGYNVIANANKILLELENHRDVVTDQLEYSLIRGELLAIRAYVHFDIIRMYGLSSWDGENASKLAAPYVTLYDKEPTVQRSYSETAALLNADIDEAIELLAVDPVRGSVPEKFEESLNADGFWNKRTLHLNYYAARALKVRILMWQKQYDEAAALAREILDEALEREVVKWIDPVEQLNIVEVDTRDWVFSCEHLFSLEVADYYDIVKPYFFDVNNAHGNYLLLSEGVVSELYQRPYIFDDDGMKTLVGDIRGPAMMLNYSPLGYRIYKYYASSSSPYRNRQPMIRISELCMVCAEVAIRNNDMQTAADYINMLHAHRGVDDTITPTNTEISKQPMFFLWEELIREFVCEGRLYFWIKRCNIDTWREDGLSSGISTGSREIVPDYMGDLIYPYPTEETSYGHIQEK